MTAGVPIITTNIGGNPELITDGKEGLLVNYNNHAELLEAVYKILSNQDLARRFTANAGEKLKFFKWEKTVAQTIEAIKAIAYEESRFNQPAI